MAYTQAQKEADARYRATERGKDKRREQRRRWRNTPQGRAVRAAQARRYRATPKGKLTNALRVRLGHALRGECKSIRTLDLLGCTVDELRVYIEGLWVEGMSWDNYGRDGWHIDHIKPCASFDLSDPAQQRECFHYTNLQPLWAKDNIAKGATT